MTCPYASNWSRRVGVSWDKKRHVRAAEEGPGQPETVLRSLLLAPQSVRQVNTSNLRIRLKIVPFSRPFLMARVGVKVTNAPQ